jgi:hypothetical protein
VYIFPSRLHAPVDITASTDSGRQELIGGPRCALSNWKERFPIFHLSAIKASGLFSHQQDFTAHNLRSRKYGADFYTQFLEAVLRLIEIPTLQLVYIDNRLACRLGLAFL